MMRRRWQEPVDDVPLRHEMMSDHPEVKRRKSEGGRVKKTNIKWTIHEYIVIRKSEGGRVKETNNRLTTHVYIVKMFNKKVTLDLVVSVQLMQHLFQFLSLA